MKNKTLLIMAAGMGSRFGGLKQVEPVGPNGEVILEYSIYDALKYGFNKIVFVIKEENYGLFRKIIGEKIEKIVEVKYVFQKEDEIKKIIDIPKTRIKPLGTAHAIWCCRNVINEPFGVINADDFYGREAFKILSKSLDHENEFSIISYKVKNTTMDTGEVKRGDLIIKNNYVSEIYESIVKEENNKYFIRKIDCDERKEVDGNKLISMNMFGFTPKLLEYLDKHIKDFFKDNASKINDVEYMIANVVNEMIEKNLIKLKNVETNAKWIGMTYKEDLDVVKRELALKHKNNEYPNKLF